MKIDMLTKAYASATGLKLQGPGIHEVDDERGAYLLSTFPEWFQPVEDDEPELVVAAQPDNTGEVDTAQEPSEPSTAKPVSRMNKAELIDHAVSMNIDLQGEVTVEELRAALKAQLEADAV